MSRMQCVLALLLAAVCAAAQETGFPFNTVTAVATNPNFKTTIKIFVETPACAVDNTMFLQNYLACNFTFVEDRLSGKTKVASVRCPRNCAKQWSKISKSCYQQFRSRMEGAKLFGDLATKFFDTCDANTKQDVVSSDSLDTTGGSQAASGSGTVTSSKPPKASGTSAGSQQPTVSATSLTVPAPAPAADQAAGPSPVESMTAAAPAPEEGASAAPAMSAAATPAMSTDAATGSGGNGNTATGGSNVGSPASDDAGFADQAGGVASTGSVTGTGAAAEPTASAVGGAEAPEMAETPIPGPAPAISEIMPAPMPEPVLAAAPSEAVPTAELVTSNALAATVNCFVLALVGALAIL